MDQRMDMRGGGTLTLGREGNRVRMEALRPGDDRGLYKVWLLGPGGGRLLLGTLTPEGTMLRLKRTLSQNELERAGCWPLAGAEAVLAFPFAAAQRWYRENHPERLLEDPVLRGQLRGPMLCRKEGEGFRLAVPFRADTPMALESLFCLAQLERLEGRPYLVWSFDRAGRPVIPHKDGPFGQE